MKVWYGYGSEHSANLVMIGRFREPSDAAKAKQVIEWLTAQVVADEEAGLIEIGGHTLGFTEGMSELLRKVKTYSIGPTEQEQFAYDVTVEVNGSELVVTTDEIDVSAFLKVLIDHGARVEVYSAHDYPGTGRGRGE